MLRGYSLLTDTADIPNDIEEMEDHNNRKFNRTDFNVKGFVNAEDRDYPVNVLNISMNGILVSSPSDVPVQEQKNYPLRISLKFSDISIYSSATLVRKNGNQLGFRFTSVEADGMIHLRRLLELNQALEGNEDQELDFLKEKK